MQDLIDFEKGTASASTPAKPTNFLIDYNFDDMDTAATPAAVAESNKVVEAQEATHAWEKYVKAAQETKKRVPVIDGPFNKAGSDEFEEMWKAKMAGEHDIINPFLRPNGPSLEHIILLQTLDEQGQSIDYIAHYLAVTFPYLMAGWKTGTEYDRCIQVHGLVNMCVSMWAPKFAKDGSIREGKGGGEEKKAEVKKGEVKKGGFKGKGDGKSKAKLSVPDWLKK